MITPGDKKTTKQNSFTVEDLNEHIKNYIIDFIDDFSLPQNKEKEVTLRKTTIEMKVDKKFKQLPVTITTTAHKSEDGVIRDISFGVSQTKRK